jgi:hypothetical protein
METRVRLVIQSNLSDAMVEMESNPTLAYERLSFVKYLVYMFLDTQQRIDVEEVYDQYKEYSITEHKLY